MPASAAILYSNRFGLIGLFGVLFFGTLFRPICFGGFISLLPKRLASLIFTELHNKKFKSFASLTGTRIKPRAP
jgi:hypothetical protein